MHFRMECGTRTFIKPPPRLLCIQIERAHGLINYRMIISHPALRPRDQFLAVAGYDPLRLRSLFPKSRSGLDNAPFPASRPGFRIAEKRIPGANAFESRLSDRVDRLAPR